MSVVNKKLEQAIARALAGNDTISESRMRITDAATVARMVVRTWGDDAPEILERATELARASK